jgi:hypothetical protein
MELNSGEGKARLGQERGGGVLRGSPTTDSGGWTALRACRGGGLADGRAGGHWSSGSGELSAGARE